MIRRSLITLPITTLLFLGGCGHKVTEKKYLVAFSQCNDAEPYRAAQNASLRKLFGKDSDVDLVIADAQQDNSKQIAQVEAFIRQRPNLLIVAPNERAPLTGVMGQAYAEHIPVICLERDILQPNYTSYIKSDNRKIGELAGQFIADALKQKHGEARGNIVELRGLLGVEGEVGRYEGAHSVFRKCPGIRIVHEAVADWIQAKAKDRMTEALRVQPDIDVVYAHNDPMAVGAYLAAKELGREKEMMFVGIDGLQGPSGGIKAVAHGILSATFVYPLCTDKAYEIGSRILREPGFHPQKIYTVESMIVTKANATQLQP